MPFEPPPIPMEPIIKIGILKFLQVHMAYLTPAMALCMAVWLGVRVISWFDGVGIVGGKRKPGKHSVSRSRSISRCKNQK